MKFSLAEGRMDGLSLRAVNNYEKPHSVYYLLFLLKYQNLI